MTTEPAEPQEPVECVEMHCPNTRDHSVGDPGCGWIRLPDDDGLIQIERKPRNCGEGASCVCEPTPCPAA